MEKMAWDGPEWGREDFFLLIQTLSTFWAERILILRNCIFWIFWIPIFQISGSPKIVFTGGLPPPRPPALPGGLPAPQTPWRGACSPPCPPAYREALPLGLSVFFGTKILVPGSWYQDLGTKIFGGTGPCMMGEPPSRPTLTDILSLL